MDFLEVGGDVDRLHYGYSGGDKRAEDNLTIVN